MPDADSRTTERACAMNGESLPKLMAASAFHELVPLLPQGVVDLPPDFVAEYALRNRFYEMSLSATAHQHAIDGFVVREDASLLVRVVIDGSACRSRRCRQGDSSVYDPASQKEQTADPPPDD